MTLAARPPRGWRVAKSAEARFDPDVWIVAREGREHVARTAVRYEREVGEARADAGGRSSARVRE